MERSSKAVTTSVVVLAVLGSMAALSLMKAILIPVSLALLLACLLGPAITGLRRILPLGATGAAVVLFLLLVMVGLYLASLTAENLVKMADTLPSDAERLAGRLSERVADAVRAHPQLRGILPDPKTIDQLGFSNAQLIANLRVYRADITGWVAQGFIILILVLFLLAESEMLAPKAVRFFTPAPGEAHAAQETLRTLTRQVRAYLAARTLINLGMGLILAVAFKIEGLNFSLALGLFAAVTNYVPYVGQVLGGGAAVLVALGQFETLGDALIVAAIFLAVVTVEGYVVTPYVMGRSLDLNGTTVLIACLFWGFLWGLVGLVLAMPITVSMKLVFQHVPELHRWAELMSRDWQPPPLIPLTPPTDSDDALDPIPSPTAVTPAAATPARARV